MKMTKREVGDFWLALNHRSLGELKGVKFSYGVAKNKIKIRGEINALDKAKEDIESITKDYDEARIDILKEFADKDENGNPETFIDARRVVQFKIVENRSKVEEKVEELQKEHKESIDKQEKEKDIFNGILKEEVEVDVYMISIEDIPEDISVASMTNLTWMISE